MIGKLVCELYHLVLRHAAAEEYFLNRRTLLLHIYDAVTLNNKTKEQKGARTTGRLNIVMHEARRVVPRSGQLRCTDTGFFLEASPPALFTH